MSLKPEAVRPLGHRAEPPALVRSHLQLPSQPPGAGRDRHQGHPDLHDHNLLTVLSVVLRTWRLSIPAVGPELWSTARPGGPQRVKEQAGGVEQQDGGERGGGGAAGAGGAGREARGPSVRGLLL